MVKEVSPAASAGDQQTTETMDVEAMSPAARLFHSSRFNCCIISIMGIKTTINPDIVKAGLTETLLKHPRFSSKLMMNGRRKKKWIKTSINLEDHVIIPNLENSIIDCSDQLVEDYISNLTTIPLDLSKPLWELHLLNIKTSEAESVAVFRIHHSVGDGASLMSLLIACTRKTSDPEALPTIPTKKRVKSNQQSSITDRFWIRWLVLGVWWMLTLIWNTIVDLVVFVATIFCFKDTNTPIKGEAGVELNPKRFVHRTLSLDHIKLVKNAMNVSINDVILGVTQAGLSTYLNRRYEDEHEKSGESRAKQMKRNNLINCKNIRVRAAILVNVRPNVGIQALADMMAKGSKTKWGNSIGYFMIPIAIALEDHNPFDYIRRAKATIDRKKHSLEAFCTFLCATFLLKLLGAEVASVIARRVLFNTTMAFSNMVGPVEDISFYGHPITFIAPSVYGHPHALTIHFQSYVNKMTIALAVDPNVIPDPHRLLDDLDESLVFISETVVKQGLGKEDV